MRRWLGLVLASLLSCGPALQHTPAPTPLERSSAATPRLSVASFNVYFPASSDASTVDLIRRTGADVVFLQEVSPDWEQVLFQRYRGTYPHMLFVPARGASGLGVLSRFPLRDEGLLPARFKHPAWLVAVQTPFREVHVLNVHLRASARPQQNLLAGLWTMSADHEAEIRSFIEACPVEPTLVLGDFNEGQAGSAVEWLERRGFVDALPLYRPGEPTWRALPLAGLFRSTLDHILFQRSLPAVDAWVLRGGRSDHWPVLAEFELGPPGPEG